MHNRQLDTFLKIAELGSFSKAADALYITPSAVIQQINSLESSLGAKLLDRTSRGVTLTPAGELLCREGRKLVDQSNHIRQELASLQDLGAHEIRVGTSLLYQCRAFYPLWRRFTDGSGDYQVAVQDLETIPYKGWRVDLIESVFFAKDNLNGMAFLPLVSCPLVCAVWKEHPLARKPILHYEDMEGQTLVTLDPAYCSSPLQSLRQEAEAHGIKVLSVERYDLPTFSMCAANGYLLQIPQFWQDIHPQLVPVPCDWSYSLPYGFFYQKSPSPLTRQFISFVEKLVQEPDFSLGL